MNISFVYEITLRIHKKNKVKTIHFKNYLVLHLKLKIPMLFVAVSSSSISRFCLYINWRLTEGISNKKSNIFYKNRKYTTIKYATIKSFKYIFQEASTCTYRINSWAFVLFPSSNDTHKLIRILPFVVV